MRLLIAVLCLSFSGVLYATDVQATHPMAAMSDTELEVVTDHDHSKDEDTENSQHTHGDQETLSNTVRLKTDRLGLTVSPSTMSPTQPVITK